MGFGNIDKKLNKSVKDVFDDEDKVHHIEIDKIIVKKQVRTEFENAEQTIESFAATIKAEGLQSPVTLRKVNDELVLVSGERRLRACKLLGMPTIKAFIKDMDDRKAKVYQFSENVNRKDLTMIEEAAYLQDLVDELGGAKAALEVVNSDDFLKLIGETTKKTEQWLSKRLALLKLPDNAKRLLTERISTDVEAINMVAQIEKVAPEKAKDLVDDLKTNKGQNVRDKAKAVKDQVKPSKKEKPSAGAASVPATPKWLEEQRKKDAERAEKGGGGNVATPPDRSFEEPSNVEILSGGDVAENTQVEIGGMALDMALEEAYKRAVEGETALKVLEDMASHKESIKEHLLTHYNAGRDVKDLSRAVLRGFRSNQFSTSGAGALALAAFLYGSDSGAKFSLVDIIGSVKA